VEEGPHEALLAADGHYARLYRTTYQEAVGIGALSP
jgi:ABC-type multidrug transport system fused ATPase/permease subunit